MVASPKNFSDFMIECYSDMRTWFRILTKGVILCISMGFVFSLFISLYGLGFVAEQINKQYPLMELESFETILKILSFFVFGSTGAYLTRKLNPFGVYKMLIEVLNKEEKQDKIESDSTIGYECERCGMNVSLRNMQLFQTGAPLAAPSDECNNANSENCVYHWAKKHPITVPSDSGSFEKLDKKSKKPPVKGI